MIFQRYLLPFIALFFLCLVLVLQSLTLYQRMVWQADPINQVKQHAEFLASIFNHPQFCRENFAGTFQLIEGRYALARVLRNQVEVAKVGEIYFRGKARPKSGEEQKQFYRFLALDIVKQADNTYLRLQYTLFADQTPYYHLVPIPQSFKDANSEMLQCR